MNQTIQDRDIITDNLPSSLVLCLFLSSKATLIQKNLNPPKRILHYSYSLLWSLLLLFHSQMSGLINQILEKNNKLQIPVFKKFTFPQLHSPFSKILQMTFNYNKSKYLCQQMNTLKIDVSESFEIQQTFFIKWIYSYIIKSM